MWNWAITEAAKRNDSSARRVQKAVRGDLCRRVSGFLSLPAVRHTFCEDQNQCPLTLAQKRTLSAQRWTSGDEMEPEDAL